MQVQYYIIEQDMKVLVDNRCSLGRVGNTVELRLEDADVGDDSNSSCDFIYNNRMRWVV